MEERLAFLEKHNAQLRARMDLMLITMASLLSGELSQSLLAKTLESLIANALNTTAPDATVEALERDGAAILEALSVLDRNRS